jgi:hypothetical protein
LPFLMGDHLRSLALRMLLLQAMNPIWPTLLSVPDDTLNNNSEIITLVILKQSITTSLNP